MRLESMRLETAQLETAQLETAQLETAQPKTAQLEAAQLEARRLSAGARLAVSLALIGLCCAPSAHATPPQGGGLEPGAWALHVEVVGTRDVPLLGAVRNVMVTDALVDIRLKDGRLEAHQTTCAITSGSALFDGGASPALVAGLPTSVWDLVVDGDFISARVGPLPLGYRGGSAIPKDAGDPRVFDPDGNGRPGAAMLIQVPGIGGFEIDVVATSTTDVRGRVVAPGQIRGTAHAHMSERVIGGLPLNADLGPLVVNPAQSSFSLVRLRDGSRGCASLEGGETHDSARDPGGAARRKMAAAGGP